MTAPIDAIGRPTTHGSDWSWTTPEYDEAGRALPRLARERPAHDWHAVARIDGRYAGRALGRIGSGSIAGVYDMEVAPVPAPGLGSALLRTVTAAAARRGRPTRR